MKLKVGIFFGGISREREISFAGGRTVYDNLNKSLFEAVPIFVDSFGNFVLLDWHFIYKGSIRDFYPPVSARENTDQNFQIYAESLGEESPHKQHALLEGLGRTLSLSALRESIDFAFLCLHGTFGEDGRIQGLLEYAGIPYSGSGILSSAIGIDKAIQKRLMKAAGFAGPAFLTIHRKEWENNTELSTLVRSEVGFPCVVKPAHQGSSIGVSIVKEDSQLAHAVDAAFFIRRINQNAWKELDETGKKNYIRSLSDIREGLGMPLYLSVAGRTKKIFRPELLLNNIETAFAGGALSVTTEAFDGESEVVIEQFIEGREFSCIVIRNEEDKPVALPPTEIRKGKDLFDYRSKYLPGLSRKITPVELPYEQIQHIRKECERLFLAFNFNVYARIDGFITRAGEVYLNDPNTTSGMMPSSFFFHQAAEIGLNPSQFLTFIVRMSLYERMKDMQDRRRILSMLQQLDDSIVQLQNSEQRKIRVAVIMGGYSSERHISVESGRNIYEKLASSDKYTPVPVFLTGSDDDHRLWQIPVNLMLKDNADDIREKVNHFTVHEVIKEIMLICEKITAKYTASQNVLNPRAITYNELAEIADVAFIALHGRPGEDGAVQHRLEELNIPYNGSGEKSSRITINKYDTNELLRKNGFLVASHELVGYDEWEKDEEKTIRKLLEKFHFPFIVKPVDDGCSSAVKKIRNEKELRAFAKSIFRSQEPLNPADSEVLNLRPSEEFPRKKQFLVEALIGPSGAQHFLEITGGLLTRSGEHDEIVFEVFEASEALSGGDVLSLEEKFLAGEGQNITPARYAADPEERDRISEIVKSEFRRAAALLHVEGYARIDAFVRVFADGRVETVFIEVNSLPGMTPATCIFHQTALAGYKPYDFIDRILEYGMKKRRGPVKI